MTFLDQYIVSRTKSRMRLRIPQLKSNETAVKIFDEVRNLAAQPGRAPCQQSVRARENSEKQGASQGGERQHDALWRSHPCINLAEKLETPYICGNRVHRVHAFAYVSVPKDFDEITQGLQDSEAFFLSLL